MAQPAISIQTIDRSEPLKAAIRHVFIAMRADFGQKFTRLFDRVASANAISANAWMWRLLERVDGCDPGDVLDGFDRCLRDRSPHMPVLAEIADAINAEKCDRMRIAEQIGRAAGPKFTGGVVGYVEQVLTPNAETPVAQRELAKIREILSRPPPKNREERNERLDRALAEHNALLAKLPRPAPRGEYKHCAVPGCANAGAFSRSVIGGGAWFCTAHFRST
jgi:hypothetical protein